MTDNVTKLLDTIECCRMNEMCDRCPMRDEICDDLYVEMVRMPSELVDRIEEELSKRQQ